MELAINLTQQGEYDLITFVGPINEEAEVYLGEVASKIGAKCIINFKKVEYVNSCGVRGFINFIRELEQGREVIFEECTAEIITQINMIPSFKGKATIKSLYCPYSCDDCGNEEMILLEQGRNLPASNTVELDSLECPQCKSEMEMEELEEEFFSFLAA